MTGFNYWLSGGLSTSTSAYSGMFNSGSSLPTFNNISKNLTGSILGFSAKSFEDEFDQYIDSDNRPDFEKSYDIYLKDNDTKNIRKMFVDAMKIGWSIGKLNNK